MSADLFADGFAFGEPLEVNKPFKIAGREYKRGDVFPYRKLAVSERKVRQLFRVRFLRKVALPPVKEPQSNIVEEQPITEKKTSPRKAKLKRKLS